jgi:serine/threonine-protein kinase
MNFVVPIDDARQWFPEYTFVRALTPSVQKAAFHVQDEKGEDLCLKLIAPNYALDRLQREVKALLNVSHPNVVQFVEYTFTIHDKIARHYIIEKFIDGTDLSDHLGSPWDTSRAAQFFEQLLSGLAELKRLDLVHRDLKPSNIRVQPNGSPVIIDLGLARHLDMPHITKTAFGAAIGTPIYFAPEQFSNDRNNIDHRTDLFAAGILLYYALVGHHPFESSFGDMNMLADAICNSEDHYNDPGFVALPNPWKLAVKKLLGKQREQRFNDAAQAASAIRKVGGLA